MADYLYEIATFEALSAEMDRLDTPPGSCFLRALLFHGSMSCEADLPTTS